jgi:sugar O-acyltransferase (sialic acid O-acetyltransferase NeuD family)
MILGIYCCGSLGCEILELARQINADKDTWSSIYFIDDKQESEVHGVKTISFDDWKVKIKENEGEIIIANGEPEVRKILADKVASNDMYLATLIYSKTYIPETTTIGKGAIINIGCFISCDAKICDNVLIQPHVIVGHNCTIGANSVLSGFVNLGGNVSIGEQTYIGLSASVRDELHIGNDVIIGMGSVIQKDIPNNVITVGYPSRPIMNNDEKRVFKH